jgi:hypothetical protein
VVDGCIEFVGCDRELRQKLSDAVRGFKLNNAGYWLENLAFLSKQSLWCDPSDRVSSTHGMNRVCREVDKAEQRARAALKADPIYKQLHDL